MTRVRILSLVLGGLMGLAPLLAKADEAAVHYNMALQLKRAGRNAEAVAAWVRERCDDAEARFAEGARLEKVIRKNLRGLGYGG